MIELPTWLGDAVMATPAIENIINYYENSNVTLIGSINSTEALKHHPKINRTFVLEKNYISLYKITRQLGRFDIFFSFRSSYRTKFLSFFISSKKKYQIKKEKNQKYHQV
ncbi:uncharacterized protein METZ01_LOCUS391206, partial [marine metagenome]